MDDTRNESKISLIGIVNVKFYDCKIGCKYQYLRLKLLSLLCY
jgi:hypothetical protein